MTDNRQFAGLFPEVSHEDWLHQVNTLLKGRSFDTLLNRTSEGLELKPLYEADGAERPLPGAGDRRRGTRQSSNAWEVLERVQHPNPVLANKELLQGLASGATALQLILQPDVYERSPGVRAVNQHDIKQLLSGVELDALAITLDAGAHASAYGDAILNLAAEQNFTLSNLKLYVACDPAAALASDGTLPGASEELYLISSKQAKRFADRLPYSRALGADGRVYHAAGASDAQELAATIAAALEHVRALEKENVDFTTASSQILFRVALDANIIAGAVKQRALRSLWSKVCAACGDEQAADTVQIHSETATRMLHRFDPWVNQLRATAATLAAALGGSQLVSTHGYDETAGLPSALAARCARNNQLILQQESHLHAVTDPLGGSGFAETYTDQLVQCAWQELQKLETEGGLIASLKAGKIQARIVETKNQRLGLIAKRRQAITGVSEFPNSQDQPPQGRTIDWQSELTAAATRADTRLIDLPDGAPAFADALAPTVLGEHYESLRLAALVAENSTSVALLTLGAQASFAARSTFCSNLLAAGGLQSVESGELHSSRDAVELWRRSGSKCALLCGSDEHYQQMALPISQALKDAGCKHIYLAGKATELQDELEKNGVKGYVHLGMDAVAFLQQMHSNLGLTA